MIVCVRLTEHEEKRVVAFADALAKMHEHKCKNDQEVKEQRKKARVGMIAEACVIKCLNERFRAAERIFFNEHYSEKGGDGGKDFTFAGISFDVKLVSVGEGCPRCRIAASTADMIVLTSFLGGAAGVRIYGFVPRNKFLEEGRESLKATDCLPLATLKRIMPSMFIAMEAAPFRRHPILHEASSFMHEGRLELRVGDETKQQ